MFDDLTPKPDSLFHEEEQFPLDSAFSHLLENTALDTPELASSILAQYSKDLENPLPCQYDFEFISTYFDNELQNERNTASLAEQRIHSFEQHLPHCAPCNSHLGLLYQLVEQYRQYFYRLEEQLDTLDVTRTVMDAYINHPVADPILDERVALPEVGCGRTDIVQFSVYLDGMLSPADAETLKLHLDSCHACRNAFEAFETGTHVVMHRLGALLEGSAAQFTIPDFWPLIAVKIPLEAASSPVSVIPLEKPKSAKRWAAYVTASIAASLFVIFLSGRMLLPVPVPVVNKPVDSVALQAALDADQQDSRQNSATVTSAAYTSPEAYLFSSESDTLPTEEFTNSSDISAIVLRQR